MDILLNDAEQAKEELMHFGVLGMKWGHHKVIGNSSPDYKTAGFTIKKGTTLHRISSISNEKHQGSGYASFLKDDATSYRKMASVFSKFGMTQYDMSMKAKKNLTSPSQKERIDVFLKKMKDPDFSKQLRNARLRMFILNVPSVQDFKTMHNNKGLSLNKAMAYRMLNYAISGKKDLRKAYLNEFKKRHYDFILDETDANNTLSMAPIIFIQREKSLDVVNVEQITG